MLNDYLTDGTETRLNKPQPRIYKFSHWRCTQCHNLEQEYYIISDIMYCKECGLEHHKIYHRPTEKDLPRQQQE